MLSLRHGCAWRFRGADRPSLSRHPQPVVFMHAGWDAPGLDGPAARRKANGPRLWTRPDAGGPGVITKPRLPAFFLRGRERNRGSPARTTLGPLSKAASGGDLRAALPPPKRRRAATTKGASGGQPAGCHVDWSKHAQAGKVHGRVPAATQRHPDGRGGGRLRFSRRQSPPSPALDATLRPGVVFPSVLRTAAIVETLSQEQPALCGPSFLPAHRLEKISPARPFHIVNGSSIDSVAVLGRNPDILLRHAWLPRLWAVDHPDTK